jgi:ligand-binding SRPBCC domain-containing protein
VSYGEMMRQYARLRGLHRLLVPVPVLTPRLSGLWLALVTPTQAQVGRALVEGLKNATVVRSTMARETFRIEPTPLRDAFLKAIDEGSAERMKTDTRTVVVDVSPAPAFAPVRRIGGATGWYFGHLLWSARGWFDRCLGGVGMTRGRRDADSCVVGDVIDGWTVEAYEPDRLLRLSADIKLPGRGWLEFEVTPVGGTRSRIRQTAMFDPRGLLGRAYWYLSLPLHAVMFRGMLARIARHAVDAAASDARGIFTYRSLVTGRANDVFRWHERPEALLELLPSRRFIRIERRTGGLRDGGSVAFSIGIGPLRLRWEARHHGYILGERFCDEQIRGPFRIWRHTHRFVAVGNEQTLYEDRIEYVIPGGRLVARLTHPVVRHLLARMFARRHQIVRAAFADARDAALRWRIVAPSVTHAERLRIVR